MKIRKIHVNSNFFYLSILPFLLLVLSISLLIVYAQEITYCGNGISICSFSAPGKGEAGDGTMDSCADGTEADTLAYVKNLTIRDLNNTKFYIGDVVEIYGLFGCSASNDGFRAAFVYNYGNYSLNDDGTLKNWTALSTNDCDANSNVEYYYNLTLANVVGNHTIRGLITYKYKATLGCSVPTNLTCGSTHEDATDCLSSRWSETDDITFLVLDNKAPNVTLSYPVNNSWAATTPINFNFTATDNLGAISNCTLFTNFSGTFKANSTIRLPANNSNQNISARPVDGNYIWNIECVDNSTNSNFSISNFTINVDTTFPRAEFINITPANNSFQSSRTVTLNVSINESNNASVILNWNGSNSTTLYNAFSIFWNITNSSLNGTYSVYVFVNDSAGNANTTITRQFTVDPVAPTNFNLTLPRNSSVASTAANLSPLLNWTPTTEDNFQNYTIQFSNLSNFSIINRTFVTTGNVTNTSFQITQNLDNNVTWYWRVIAFDKAGNSMNSTQTFIYVTNTSEPSVVLNYPPNNYISKFVNISFNHTPSDTDLSRCELVANFSGVWKGNRSDGSPISGVVNNIANVTLTDGNYIWNVNCSDATGLTAFASTNFTLTVDLTFPRVEFFSPTPANNTAQSSTTVVINVSINESARDKIILNFNGTNETNTLSNPFSIYWNITKTSLAGTYDIYIFVNDTAGNANTTITRQFTVDNAAPRIVNESAKPNAAINNSLFNITAAITDNFNVNFSIAEVQRPNSTKENLTMNKSSGDIYSVTFNGTTNGTFIVIIYANDSVNNRAQTNPFNFTVDILMPNISNINYTPTSIDAIDPNASINVSATVTDNFLVDTVLILYKKDSDSLWINATASNVSSLYWGNFTPNSAGNWSFAVWANDTSGNVNISANTTINVSFDFTWNVTPAELGVIGGIKGANNVVLGNLTINNTGEFNMTFVLAKKSGVPTVSFNISSINVSNHSTEIVQVLANAPSTAATYVIDVYVNSTNLSASPQSRVVNATFSVTEGGPFLFLQIVKFDASVTASSTTVLNAKLTDTGNDTCTNGIAEWTLPSDWTILAGLTGEKNISIGSLVIGASAHHNLTVKAGSSTGTKTITIAGNCSNGGTNNTLSETVTVTSSGGGESSGGSSGGGGGGGGGGGAAGNIKSVEAKTFASVAAGSSISLEIAKADISVTKLTVIVNKELKAVQIQVSSLIDKPVAKAAAAAVYQYLELTKSNIAEKDVDRITINFRVPKAWLSNNGLQPQDITLYRYEQQWNELETKIVDSDESFMFYEADSPGFSSFAIGTKQGIVPGVLLLVDDIVEIVRGQNKSFSANITNIKANTTLADLKLEIGGFPLSQINFLPNLINEVIFNETKSFNITINVPSYIGENKYPLKILMNGKRITTYNISSTIDDISIFKNVTLIVFKTVRAQIEYCLAEAEKEIGELEAKGFNTQKANAMFNDANKALGEFEYENAGEICGGIRSLNAKALKASDEISAIGEQISKLKKKGFDMSSAEKALQLAHEALNNGEFEKAEDLVEDAKLIVTLQVSAEEARILKRIKKFIVNYWWTLLIIILLVSATGLVVYNSYSAASLKSQIKDLENEEKSLLESMKKVQWEYFTDKTLTKGLYEKYISKYKERLAQIKQKMVSLKARRISLLKISENIGDLERERNEIGEFMKDIQHKYFEEKIIDKNLYNRLILEFKGRIAEIENKITLTKEKKKTKEGQKDKPEEAKKEAKKKLKSNYLESIKNLLIKNPFQVKKEENEKDKQVTSVLTKEHIGEIEKNIQEALKHEKEEKVSSEKESLFSSLNNKLKIKLKKRAEGTKKHHILKYLKEVYKNE